MTWPALHRRGEVLHAVVAEAARRQDGLLPTDVTGVAETFRDELDLLGALQLRWYTRLTGRIERELAHQPLDLETAVITAWRAAAEELPGVRAILDHYREHPVDDRMAAALATATAKEHQALALMAGLVSTMEVDEHGARLGARLEEAARHAAVLSPSRDSSTQAPGAHRRAPGNPAFLARLKAALAA